MKLLWRLVVLALVTSCGYSWLSVSQGQISSSLPGKVVAPLTKGKHVLARSGCV